MENFLPVRVVVADHHRAMLFTASQLLEAEDDLEVVGAADDLDRAARMATEHEAQVLVVDLRMLGGSSRAKITQLRRELPSTAIVILTMEASAAFVPAVLDAGASAYVLKEFAEVDLAEAVREAALGHSFVSEQLAA